MSDEAQIRSFLERQSVLGRLVRAFPPRPQLFVFADVRGLALDVQRHPHTHQVFVGMSLELYYRFQDKVLMQTGEKIDSRFESKMMVQGRALSIPIKELAYIADPVPNTLAEFTQDLPPLAMRTIEIEPKPVPL